MIEEDAYDVIIVGAGLVGVSLAIALAKQNFRIALLETHLPSAIVDAATTQTAKNDTPTIDTKTDHRPLTLNYASQQILAHLGLWDSLRATAAPIHQVIVSEQGHFGKLRFHAHDYQLPALGYVVSLTQLHQQLYQQAARSSCIHLICIKQVSAIHHSTSQVTVDIITGSKTRVLRAQLLVGADGSQSITRSLHGLRTHEYAANDQAFIATLTAMKPHQHIAYERFTSQGTLAILPLLKENQLRLVWTLTQLQWEEIESWSHEKREAYLNRNFSMALGSLHLDKTYQRLPLKIFLAKKLICPGFVLLGNAAHTIYPLAAQGFNLGLNDAAALCDVITDARQQNEWIGHLNVLERYVAWRQPQQEWIAHTTWGISQLFGLKLPFAGLCRSVGLLLTDLCPSLKNNLGQHLLGLSGQLPRLVITNQNESLSHYYAKES